MDREPGIKCTAGSVVTQFLQSPHLLISFCFRVVSNRSVQFNLTHPSYPALGTSYLRSTALGFFIGSEIQEQCRLKLCSAGVCPCGVCPCGVCPVRVCPCGVCLYPFLASALCWLFGSCTFAWTQQNTAPMLKDTGYPFRVGMVFYVWNQRFKALLLYFIFYCLLPVLPPFFGWVRSPMKRCPA